MTDVQVHGVINYEDSARKANYLYRVSMKALIRNEQGEVLVVKETGRDWWDLPGGGMDHDEDIKLGLARELHEEIGLEGDFTHQVIHVEDPFYLPSANVWQIRLIFEVIPEQTTFHGGDESDEVRFISPETLKDSDIKAERQVYKYAQNHL